MGSLEHVNARILRIHADHKNTPIVKMRGDWLREYGFKQGEKVAVCMEEYGKLTIINMDIATQRTLEEEFEKMVILQE